MLACSLAGICAGCPWITMAYDAQLGEKQRRFRALWAEAGLDEAVLGDLTLHSVGEGGLRDRVDLTLYRETDGMRLGLYDLDHKHIVDMETCPMMSDALREWLTVFRASIPEIRLGGVRLRVAPSGERGLWLDFPNEEIKRFLDERDWLTLMKNQAFVEMGQRRKALIPKGEGLGLGDPVLKPWFETYLGDEESPQSLYCHVGSFTQVGTVANRALVRLVRAQARATGGSRWLELGAGIGNFTLPLAAEGWSVSALENDPRALEGLERSLTETNLTERVRFYQANMHGKDKTFPELLARHDAVLADPPRSGLRAFVDVLASVAPADRPMGFVYVSCFAESLIGDVARLMSLGYEVMHAEGLDQFPQSDHAEWVIRLRRNPEARVG